MDTMWWRGIRMMLGLPRMTRQEIIDELHYLSHAEICVFAEQAWLAQYGRMNGGMHAFEDRRWWLDGHDSGAPWWLGEQ